MKRLFMAVLLPALFSSVALSGEVQRIHVRLAPDAGPVTQAIARVFSDQVTRRCHAKIVAEGNADFLVELALDPKIGQEGYRIDDGTKGGVCIVGQNERGLLYGVGKFLRTSRFDQGGFTPSVWRGTSVPALPVRGVYFATHFHNFYHDAPLDEVRQYVEELGLQGANLLVIWYDMHHFDGFDDPKAVEFRQRLSDICRTAKAIGLGVGFGVVANEGYANSPTELRAQKEGGQRGGWYDCQICPSKPGGLAHILTDLGQEFDWWAAFQPEYLVIWPYDQGGCGCVECRPWGGNGFLRAAEPLATLARQKLPGISITWSTWFFDATDWQGLTSVLNNTSLSPGEKFRPNYILADSGGDFPQVALDEKARGGVALLNFPEISMWGRDPWGGYGANPTPARCEHLWKQTKGKLSGGTLYSEGVFEDINKAIWLQCYWANRCDAEETLREYIAFEFSPRVTDDVARAIHLLEETWPNRAVSEKSREAATLLQRADARLPQQAKTGWRWRLLLLRAVIDSELFRTQGELRGPLLRQAFQELSQIYHAEKADPWLRPPTVAE